MLLFPKQSAGVDLLGVVPPLALAQGKSIFFNYKKAIAKKN
jgi:hypothetical protein